MQITMRAAAAIVALFVLGDAEAARAPPWLEPCRVAGIDETLRCGDLLVPENPQRSDGRKIKLHLVVLPAQERNGKQAPLFDLAGGPGLAASGGARFFATDGRSHRQHRDVVLLDQRGTGESSPLHCPELELNPLLPSMYPVDIVRRCRQTLAYSADLSQYTTANAATDIDTVRAALGYSKIDLSGLSYGTRLAVAYMRMYPQHVRSAVLIGTVADDKKLPLWHARNAQMTLDDVFADCAHDEACLHNFPELPRTWAALLRTIDTSPTITIRAGEADIPITLRRGPFSEAFRHLLYTTAGQRRAPFLIRQMSQGDFQPMAAATLTAGGESAEGLLLSVICAEDVAGISDEERDKAVDGTFLGAYRVDEQRRACKEWNVPRAQVTSSARPEIPLLLLAGERDAVTPVAWAREIAAQFPRSRVVTIPALGHFPDGLEHMECLDAMIADFFARGTVAGVDTACIAGMMPPPFALSANAPKP